MNRPEKSGLKSRSELLILMDEKTMQYGQLLLQAQELVAMNRPSGREQDSVRSKRTVGSLVGTESGFAMKMRIW